MRKKSYIFALIVSVFCLSGTSLLSIAGSEDSLKVIVSILPQKYFVEKIGGDLVDVSVMVFPGASPAIYEPRPQQMVALTRSKIYFAVGVPFEKVWLKKFVSANPEMTIVHTEDGIGKIPMEARNRHDEKEHHHGIKDPHVWLSPPAVMMQARNILDALLKVAPAQRAMFLTNYKNFINELVDLDLKIMDVFAGKGKGAKFMVYHPAWGYFARAYGLRQIPVEIEGKEPSPRQLKNLIHHAREEGVKMVFVQPQFSTRSAKTVAEAIGGQVMFADPLELNWVENLLEVAEKFKAAFSDSLLREYSKYNSTTQ